MNASPTGNERGRERPRAGRADGRGRDAGCTDRAPARTDGAGASGAIEDRTAADVFAELQASCSGTDANDVLGDDSPEAIIERADEPVEEPTVDDDLFDEAAFEELVIPDRRRDGEFLWIEIDDGDGETAAARSANPAPSARSTTAIGDGSSGPTRDRKRDDPLDEAIATFRSIRSENSETAAGPAAESSASGPSRSGEDSDPTDGDGRSTVRGVHAETGVSDTDSSEGITAEDTDATADRSAVGDESIDATTASDASDGTSSNDPSTGTKSTGATTSTGGSSSASADRPSWITDEFDAVSSPGSGKVPTREPTNGRTGGDSKASGSDRNSKTRSSERDSRPSSQRRNSRTSSSGRNSRTSGSSRDRRKGARESDYDPVGDDAKTLADDRSEVRTRLDPFEHKQREDSGPVGTVRRGLGRLVSGLRSID